MRCPAAVLHALNAACLAGPGCAQGFAVTAVATQLDSPVAMAVAPDGRVFVANQGGSIQLVRDDLQLPAPFATVPTIAQDEEGLLGIALDPQFAQNGFVYVCYTAAAPLRHNVIARLTADGDRAAPGSLQTLFELDPLADHVQVGGGLAFGADGHLYAATGSNGLGTVAASLQSTHGKLLRLRRDGTVPTDNPFVAQTTGSRRAIYARGFRNPFCLAADVAAARLYVHDIGSSQWEEINQGFAGANYGWPAHEGPGSAIYQNPVHAYSNAGARCAVTAGTFYKPATPQLPAAAVGKYLFLDYCTGELLAINPAAPGPPAALGVVPVGSVALAVAPGGALYCLSRGSAAAAGGSGPAFATGRLHKLTAPGATLATFTTFGAGCAGPDGAPTVLVNGPPRVGNDAFAIGVGNLNGSPVAVMLLGMSTTDSALGALPLELGPFGMTGCFLNVSGDTILLQYTAAAEAWLRLPIPNLAALLGMQVHAQGMVKVASVNAFGLVSSRGGTLRLGS